jgi:glycosyltransferase involved in cell wall biosynthesis
VDPSRIRVIYNGVGAATGDRATRSHRTSPYVLYVGGHEARKNVEGVLGTVKEYWLRHGPALHLRLTGLEGDLSPAARKAYEAIKHERRIRFLGHLKDEELAREYQGATALLMLSRAEGFGLPVIEAMAHGCPVIAAHCGSLPELVGQAGILVDPDDPVSAANAVHRIATSPAITNNLTTKGQARAAGFTWHRAVEAYRTEYLLAADKSRSKASRALRSPPPSESLLQSEASAGLIC